MPIAFPAQLMQSDWRPRREAEAKAARARRRKIRLRPTRRAAALLLAAVVLSATGAWMCSDYPTVLLMTGVYLGHGATALVALWYMLGAILIVTAILIVAHLLNTRNDRRRER